MASIIWTKKALLQFEQSVKYIKETQGKYYAEIVLKCVFSKVDILQNYPQVGQKEPLLAYKKYDYRYLVKFNYKVIYRLNKDFSTVYIVRVFHTAQHPTKLW